MYLVWSLRSGIVLATDGLLEFCGMVFTDGLLAMDLFLGSAGRVFLDGLLGWSSWRVCWEGLLGGSS